MTANVEIVGARSLSRDVISGVEQSRCSFFLTNLGVK